MKWLTLLGSSVVHAIAGTIGSGLLMISLMNNSYSGIFIMFAAPVIGVACGVVGLASGWYVHKKDRFTASIISTLLAASVAIVVMGLVS